MQGARKSSNLLTSAPHMPFFRCPPLDSLVESDQDQRGFEGQVKGVNRNNEA